MSDNQVLIDLLLNDRQFQESIDAATTAANKLQKQVNDSTTATTGLTKGFNSVKSGVNSLFDSVFNLKNALIGAVTAVGFTKIVAEAASAEKANNLLNVSLQRSGEYSEGAVEGLNQFAASMLKLTGIGDDAILGQIAFAKSMGLTTVQARETVRVAADLAPSLGVDFSTAVEKLAASFNGATKGLTRLNPEIKNLSDEQLAAGDAVKILGASLSGTANALTNTYGVSVDRTGTQVGNFIAKIGSLITSSPVVVELIQKIGSAFEKLTGLIEGNKAGIQQFIADFVKGIVSSGPSLIRILSTLTQGIEFFAKSVQLVTSAAISVLSTFRGFEITQGLIAGTVTIFERLAKSIVATEIGFKRLSGASAESIAASQAQYDVLQRSIDTQGKDTKGVISGFLDGLDEVGVKSFEIGDKTTTFFEGLKEQLKGAEEYSQKLASSFGTLKSTAPSIIPKSAKTDIVGDKVALPKFQESNQDLADKAGINNEGLFTIILRAFRTDFSTLENGVINTLNITQTSLSQTQAAYDDFIDQVVKRTSELGTSALSSFGSNVLGGADGAKKFISGLGAGIADTLVPGAGKAVGPIIEALSQGPDAVKAMVNQFADALPTLLDNIVRAIPVVVKALADRAPEIISVLVSNAPKIAIAITTALANPQLYIKVGQAIAENVAEAIGVAFRQVEDGIRQIDSVIKATPEYLKSALPEALKAGVDGIGSIFKDLGNDFNLAVQDAGVKFFNSIVEAANNLVKSLNPTSALSGGGGGGGVVGKIKGSLGLATGGRVIGSGTSDSAPAMLAPGELVVDRTTGPRLNAFLDSFQGKGQTNDPQVMLMLAKLIDIVSAPISVTSSAEVNGRAFADIVLNLNRTNQRLA